MGLNLLRWFLGLVVIMMVFCLGLKVGYYKAMIEGAYGDDYGYSRHGGMMGGYGYGRNAMYLYDNTAGPKSAEVTPKAK